MNLLPLRTLPSMKRQARKMGIRRVWRMNEAKLWAFCLRDLEQVELYHLDANSLHWNEGAKIVTAWQTLEEGDLPLSSGLDVPGRILPSCSVSYLFSSVCQS